MPLSGPQLDHIANAITAAYTREELRRVVKVSMEVDFDHQVPNAGFSAQVFELVSWADRQERALELLRCAADNNQGSEALRALWQELTGYARPLAAAESYDVFLSYSHADTLFARRLLGDLTAAGLTVWTDDGLAAGTHNWQDAIERAVECAACMVVVMTPRAKASKWVRAEVNLAEELGKPVLPVLAAGERKEAVLFSLRDVQYVDARVDYAPVGTRLIPDICRTLGKAASKAKPASQAQTNTPANPAAETVQPPQLVQDVSARSTKPVAPLLIVPKLSPLAAELDIEWIEIPAGEFLMGSDPKRDKVAAEDEQPQHRLFLPEFRIAKYPITNVQYAVFVRASRHDPPNHWPDGKPPAGKERHPLVNVSWYDAVAFCAWASEEFDSMIRLPSEAEWEKAARGVDGRLWPWGNEPPTSELCNFGRNENGTTAVDKYPRGASSYGVMDMAGNAWEWTRSLWGEGGSPTYAYPYYAGDGREAESAPDSVRRVLRGGSYDEAAKNLRCACRDRGDRVKRYVDIGFRVALPSTSSL